MVLFNEMLFKEEQVLVGWKKSSDFTMLLLKCLLEIQMAVLKQLAIPM